MQQQPASRRHSMSLDKFAVHGMVLVKGVGTASARWCSWHSYFVPVSGGAMHQQST